MDEKSIVERKKIEPIPMAGMKKMALLALGALLFAGAAAAGIFLLQPKTSTEEEALYTYKTVANASYRVKLSPNTLFDQEWLEEGGMYSSQLTEYIEVNFTANFVGTSEDAVLGDYNITGIVEGYQEVKDAKKTIYERRYPLKAGKPADNGKGGADVNEKISVNVQTFKQAADEAESILGGSASRSFYVLFEGTFIVDTEYGKAEEPFSLALQIPIPKTAGFYEIENPGEFSKTSTISTSNDRKIGANPLHIILIFVWAMLSLALVAATLRFTRKPNEAEAYKMQWKEHMRKYGSRMVQLKDFDEAWLASAIEVEDMDNLVMLSEEMHQPICVSLDENGLPKMGVFYVLHADKSYFFRLEKVTTSLGVEKNTAGSTKGN